MATFLSKYKELRLIMRASRPINRNGNIEITPSRHINFVNGRYMTDIPDEITFIEMHPEFNRSVFKLKETEHEKIKAVKEEIKKVAKKTRVKKL